MLSCTAEADVYSRMQKLPVFSGHPSSLELCLMAWGGTAGRNWEQRSGAVPVSSLQSFARDTASGCSLQHVAAPGCVFHLFQ